MVASHEGDESISSLSYHDASFDPAQEMVWCTELRGVTHPLVSAFCIVVSAENVTSPTRALASVTLVIHLLYELLFNVDRQLCAVKARSTLKNA